MDDEKTEIDSAKSALRSLLSFDGDGRQRKVEDLLRSSPLFIKASGALIHDAVDSGAYKNNAIIFDLSGALRVAAQKGGDISPAVPSLLRLVSFGCNPDSEAQAWKALADALVSESSRSGMIGFFETILPSNDSDRAAKAAKAIGDAALSGCDLHQLVPHLKQTAKILGYYRWQYLPYPRCGSECVYVPPPAPSPLALMSVRALVFLACNGSCGMSVSAIHQIVEGNPGLSVRYIKSIEEAAIHRLPQSDSLGLLATMLLDDDNQVRDASLSALELFAKNGIPMDLGSIRDTLMAASRRKGLEVTGAALIYTNIAEAVRSSKTNILANEDAGMLEARIKPPKGRRDSGEMFRAQNSAFPRIRS